MAAPSAGTVVINLPPSPVIGDTVAVTGQSNNLWQLTQNAGQAVLTSNLNGNVTPGSSWTPRMAPAMWHWAKSNPDGDVVVVGEAPGDLHVSVDGGTTWNVGDTPHGQIWISVDMTPNADRIVAVAYNGNMYMSSDRGVHWKQVTSSDPAINLSNREFETVTISRDGQRIVAAVMSAGIYVSTDGGVSWVAGTLAGSPITGHWRAVESSADGSIVVAAAGYDNNLFISTDAGLTWTLRNVSVGGMTVWDEWYRAAMSDDGSVIAVAGRLNSGLYFTTNGGTSWTRAATPAGNYTGIAMSPDGRIIGATITDGTIAPTVGSVQISRNGGASFTALPMPGTDTNWRTIAMSADGSRLTAAAGTYTRVTGQLYTSQGDRTSVGALGSITGGQNDYVQLRYQGSGRFEVIDSAGGPFSIR